MTATTTTPQDELLAKVREMRQLQRLYFKTHDRGVLARAKTAENMVDHLLEELDDAIQARLL